MAIEEIYQKAKSMGADALINFNAHSTYVKIGEADIPSYEVTGFAIKRKLD